MSKLSKAVSDMNQINSLRLDETVKNFMGGDSYVINPLDTLKMITASSIFGEPAYYRGSFKAIESNLLDAFQNILDVLESSLPSVVDKQRVKRMIESLCYPIPEKRGHPKAVNSREPNYDLQRYITELNYLQTKTEFELYRLTLK